MTLFRTLLCILLFPVVAFGQNAKPWEAVVRIKVGSGGRYAMGSGTVIHSTDAESIVLTCAHLFPGSNIRIDLFNGQPQSRYLGQTYDATLINYEPLSDAALVRFKPGRQLPYARVIPYASSLRPGSIVTAVGCPYGRDAVTWSTRVTGGFGTITECSRTPEQGRSGGGLFTSDGFVAGICSMAEPMGNHGLYVNPASIHAMLNRSGLAGLYSPNRPLTQPPLLASRPTRKQPVAIAFRADPAEAIAAKSKGGPWVETLFHGEYCGTCWQKRMECACR